MTAADRALIPPDVRERIRREVAELPEPTPEQYEQLAALLPLGRITRPDTDDAASAA